jgi:hypothetical protein
LHHPPQTGAVPIKELTERALVPAASALEEFRRVIFIIRHGEAPIAIVAKGFLDYTQNTKNGVVRMASEKARLA